MIYKSFLAKPRFISSTGFVCKTATQASTLSILDTIQRKVNGEYLKRFENLGDISGLLIELELHGLIEFTKKFTEECESRFKKIDVGED